MLDDVKNALSEFIRFAQTLRGDEKGDRTLSRGEEILVERQVSRVML
jgi:hypothetical protein